jgi:uncharacterized protein GlcG (DUF336 family)
MRAKVVITSRDGSERAEVREVRITEEGLAFDGAGLSLRDGDRVVWATGVPGIRGAFDVSIAAPVVH